MPTPQQSRAALALLSEEAADVAGEFASTLSGTPEARRLALDTVPGVIDYYATGAGALAADFYDERRELAGAKKTYTSEIVINDRTVKIRRAVAWSTEPLFGRTRASEAEVAEVVRRRLAAAVRSEVSDAYRATVLANSGKDPASVGWRRVTNDCCRFCQMLAARGAVYKSSTARFAAHPYCDCTAEPVFNNMAIGPEASVLQYEASKKRRSPAAKARLKAYLDEFYPA